MTDREITMDEFNQPVEMISRQDLCDEIDRLVEQRDEWKSRFENADAFAKNYAHECGSLRAELEYHKKQLQKSQENLKWLVGHAIELASISKARGAELLGVPLIDMDEATTKEPAE